MKNILIVFFCNFLSFFSFSQEVNCKYYSKNNLSTIILDIQKRYRYENISNQKGLKKEFDIEKNFDDTLKIDSTIYFSSNNQYFTYIFDGNLKTYSLIQIKLINVNFNCSSFFFNMDKVMFYKKILPNYKINVKANCFEISNSSGFDEFKFYFKNNKLYSFAYFDNTSQ